MAKHFHSEVVLNIKKEVDQYSEPSFQEDTPVPTSWQQFIKVVMKTHRDQSHSFLLKIMMDEISHLVGEFVNLIGKTCILLQEESDYDERIELDMYPTVKALFNADSSDWYMYAVDQVQLIQELQQELSKLGCDENRSDTEFDRDSPELRISEQG